VYFCCLEAVQNAGKHSGASGITIDIHGWPDSGSIEFTVHDDGRGFDIGRIPGNGLANIRDRIESLQGTVSINSIMGEPDSSAPPGMSGQMSDDGVGTSGGERSGTTIRAQIPLPASVFASDQPGGPDHGTEPAGSEGPRKGPVSRTESPLTAGG
jgi:glucose-6-phosphate-specific signal transduction histidine kinase